MDDCNSKTLKYIKSTDLYKKLPRSYGKSKMKKKDLCSTINKHYKSTPKQQTPKSQPKQKTPKQEQTQKQKLLNQLSELHSIYKRMGESFRARAYDNAYFALRSYNEQLPQTKKELMKIKGVGKSVAEKIIEYLQTGKIKKLIELQNRNKELENLMSIDGFGPATVPKLLKKGIKNIDDLRKAYNDGKIKLTNTQLLGMNNYEDLQSKIPRAEIQKFEKELKKVVKEINPELHFEIVGSYRRRKAKSGDVDLLVWNKNIVKKPTTKSQKYMTKKWLTDIVNKLKEHYKYIGQFSLGPTKFMGLFILDKKVRHIDIAFVPYENLYSYINYFTGSKEHNIRLREIALKKGYSISEYHVKKGNKIIYLKSEKQLFDLLGQKYLQPWER